MDIKSKIKQIYHELNRRRIAKKLTGNLGKVDIKNDTIFCNVNKSDIEKKRRVSFRTSTHFNCEDVASKYNLGKQVCFIVEHVDFQNGLSFSVAKNIQVTFRHCTFRNHVEITDSAGTVIFKNNNYYQDQKTSHIPFFSANIRSIKFIDEYLINSGNQAIETSSFSAVIKAKNTFFDDTLLYAGTETASVDITTDMLTLRNTTINCATFCVRAENIFTNSSTIYATDFAIIENKELDRISIIESPEVIYNGQEFVTDTGKDIVVREDTIDLIRKRIELLETLRNHLNVCTEVNPKSNNDIDSVSVTKTFSLK